MIVIPDHLVNATSVTVKIAPAPEGNTKKKQDDEDELKISLIFKTHSHLDSSVPYREVLLKHPRQSYLCHSGKSSISSFSLRVPVIHLGVFDWKRQN